ncbi:hypothetical protein [Sinorhizobium sp. BG8]|uniref:hypothetical protein n=1 Tax=Sinorhizobium sp. BG8 TaxID=2613773 RepID=UPI00193E8892|nr:hypothetical protein [Sinorhizobium sp. BG8]QRM56330.1 hypothetical protein F3Y30_18645 [Sinorhizobium sp. BG8]
MVEALVNQFRELQDRLLEQNERYDTPEFRALDARITDVFESIYRYSPASVAEGEAMIGLFLDMISQTSEAENSRLIARVRRLTSEVVALAQKQSVPLCYGAGI